MLNRLASKPFLYLEPAAFHHALCTLIISILALISSHFLLTPQPSWLLLPALLLSQAGLSAEANWHTPKQTLFYLYCGLLTAAAVFITSQSAFSFLMTIPLLILITLSTGYLGWRQRQYYFAALTLILLTLIAAFSPCRFTDALERASLILFGSLLIFIIRLLFFFYQRTQILSNAKVLFFQNLKHLYQLIFYTSGHRRPLFRQEAEESHFQIVWSDCLTALRTLKATASNPYRQSLDRIWDLTLSLSSLRYRLTDFTVLTMSQDEMQSLLKVISNLIDTELHPPSQDHKTTLFNAFENAIQAFEELYRSMLQTVAKEPLVLLLFIQDLYALKEEFERLDLSEKSARTH